MKKNKKTFKKFYRYFSIPKSECGFRPISTPFFWHLGSFFPMELFTRDFRFFDIFFIFWSSEPPQLQKSIPTFSPPNRKKLKKIKNFHRDPPLNPKKSIRPPPQPQKSITPHPQTTIKLHDCHIIVVNYEWFIGNW